MRAEKCTLFIVHGTVTKMPTLQRAQIKKAPCVQWFITRFEVKYDTHARSIATVIDCKYRVVCLTNELSDMVTKLLQLHRCGVPVLRPSARPQNLRPESHHPKMRFHDQGAGTG
jgi:hypothetical protein